MGLRREILAVSRLGLDRRFYGLEWMPQTMPLVRDVLDQIDRHLEEPDAGLWELRGVRRLHAFTLLTDWAGARSEACSPRAAGEPQPDAAMLLALHFGFLTADDPRVATHMDAIRNELRADGGLLQR